MSSDEYFGWMKYFELRPPGWKEDHRAAMLVSTTYQGKNKIKPEDYFPALKQMYEVQKKSSQHAQSFIDQLTSRIKNPKHKIQLKEPD